MDKKGVLILQIILISINAMALGYCLSNRKWLSRIERMIAEEDC